MIEIKDVRKNKCDEVCFTFDTYSKQHGYFKHEIYIDNIISIVYNNVEYTKLVNNFCDKKGNRIYLRDIINDKFIIYETYFKLTFNNGYIIECDNLYFNYDVEKYYLGNSITKNDLRILKLQKCKIL